MHPKYLAVGRHYHVSLIVKAETHDANAGDSHFSVGVGGYLNYAAMTSAAGRDIDIPVAVKRQSLRPPEP